MTVGVLRQREDRVLDDEMTGLLVESWMAASVGDVAVGRMSILVERYDKEDRTFLAGRERSRRVVLEYDFVKLAVPPPSLAARQITDAKIVKHLLIAAAFQSNPRLPL